MLLLPLLVALDLLLWWLFGDLTARTDDPLFLLGAFMLAVAGLLWVVQEAVDFAFSPDLD